MKQRVGLGVVMLALFLVANRAAFEGYFSDDDLDNLSWATLAGTPGLFADWLSLRFSETNTRATGALFYQFAGRAYGLDFVRYVPWLIGIHVLNCVLLGCLAKRRGADEVGAWAVVAFWGFHAGILEAWWKPMYVFDLLCGTFSLLAWHLFCSGRIWWALPVFLIAYRAKEVAVFLPVAFALDNWRRAWPFALVSLSFILQATRVNAGRDNDYTLRFNLESLRVTVPFYAKSLLLTKWSAVVFAPLGFFWKERQLWLGVLGSLVMLAPLLFLPKRLFSVYWYVPMIPLALGLAFVVSRLPRWGLAAGLGIWLSISFMSLREKRKSELAIAHENRAYVQQLTTFYALRPFPLHIFLDGHPPGLKDYGIRGLLRLTTGDRGVEILNVDQENDRRQAAGQDLVTLQWFRPTQSLSLVSHRYGEGRQSALDLGDRQSAWQLREGWMPRTGNFRWAGERATVGLYAPPGARELLIRFNVGPEFLRSVGTARTEIFVNGVSVGATEFREAGTPTLRYSLPPKLEGELEIALASSPGLRVNGFPAPLGIGVLSLRIGP